jgi:DNA-binding IclR family transcriptional regulator
MTAEIIVERCMGALELLSLEARGLPLTTIAQKLGLIKSGAHRLLNELQSDGFVTQDSSTQHYRLTMRFPTLGFRYLSATGIVDGAMPQLRDLAAITGELVRMTVADVGMLTWVAKAQGAQTRLRFDPDMGGDVRLHTTASGKAWLATMDKPAALILARTSGLGNGEIRGPRTIQTEIQFLKELESTRKKGYGMAVNEDEAGMSAVAVNIIRPSGDGKVLGTLSVAGPTVRLDRERLTLLAASLKIAAAAVGDEWPVQY